jgi:hypothetical protein
MRVKVERANGQTTHYDADSIVLEEEEFMCYRGAYSTCVARIEPDGQWVDEDGFCVFVSVS